MSWKLKLPKKDTGPEDSCRTILEELGLHFVSGDFLDTPFRDYPIQADFLVEGCLVIEVQSHYFHDKSRRANKDRAKKGCFEAMGLGFLDLWDDELRYADQVERGTVWRPYLKEMVVKMLQYARMVRMLWMEYQDDIPDPPTVQHPDHGLIEIATRME